MTAFVRYAESNIDGSITWEIRSVNHRHLDISLRLPELFRFLEPDLRKLAQKYLFRGKIDAFLYYLPNKDAIINQFSLNTNLAKQLSEAIKQLEQFFPNLDKIDPLQLLAWNGMLNITECSQDRMGTAITKVFQKALLKLVDDRSQEGEMLRKGLLQKLAAIDAELIKIKSFLPKIIQNQRLKLINSSKKLAIEIDQSRLEQEIVLILQKSDVTEEIDRLAIHLQELRKELNQGGIVGKKLDFLLQEINREANTIASKSISKETTSIALSLKILAEQMREQVQNLE